MRVVAGKFGGRALADTTSGNTHPMSEKMRGALFNALGDIEGLTMLDAYSGTGALAIEALSRGAAQVTSVDNDPAAFKCIAKNSEAFGVMPRLTTACTTLSSWLKKNPNATFNVITADPPYGDINREILGKLTSRLTDGGILVLSLPANCPDLQFKGTTLVKSKNYAGGSLRFYKQIAER